ncbi:division/cell wall cluster transcriptional repressor MraZ [Dethiosulfovibrio faecalis]|uniref:division/cell wall cluster transcriptional repressor MraZ n=1 Tax=Dethiosulfovibrio faecalis TaxID=2720018 RepID=UPI0030844239
MAMSLLTLSPLRPTVYLVYRGEKWDIMGVEVMFMGNYDHKIDDKGRMILPSRFRHALGSPVVCTVGIERCMSVYPLDSWQTFVARFDELPFSKEKSRNFKRVLFSMADEIVPDKTGRILIAPSLRGYGGLEEDVSVIGVEDHIEIWDRVRWNDRRSTLLGDLGKMIEEVMQ